MKSIRALYQLARADFLQRTRSYGFLITLALTLYAACLFIPPNHSAYATMQIGGHRGVYNSAYLGALMAILISPFLSLAGFYLVKNAIDRDIQTRVGQILAATPLSKPLYTIGKALSNFAVLTVLVAIMGVAAIGMQFARKEDLNLQVWPLITPLVVISLPVMCVVAGMAILFEAIPRLRGGLGNVIYFFLWSAVLTARATQTDRAGGDPYFDLFGLGLLLPSISAACETAFPGAIQKGMSIGINVRTQGQSWDLSTFRWDGLEWTSDIIFSRLFWVGAGFGLALAAAIFFRRFDPARERSKRGATVASGQTQKTRSAERVVLPVTHGIPFQPLTKPLRFSYFFMTMTELRLALHRLGLWWYLIAAAIIAIGLFSPLAVSRGALVVAWIWPLLIWSAMGTRERRYRTDQLVFSTAHPLRRQLLACWLAGVLVALATGAGTGVRLWIGGEQAGFAGWLSGAFFIPTLALVLGVWSERSMLFEVVYLLLWYLGPANGTPDLDFMGVTGAAGSSHTAALFGFATATLFVLAVIGRKRQLSQ